MTREPLELSDLLGMGLVSGVLLAAGMALGWWLDRLLKTFPAFVLVGIALGIAGGICFTIVKIRTVLKE
jgi:F0F1-type ATP synthase assembly protein I